MSLGLLGVFGAGLLTVATPCVLPLLPIYLAALVGSDIRELDSRGKGRLLARALLFVAGFTLIFTLLGLTASSMGAFLVDHKALLQTIGAGLILLFGLKFLGVLRVPWLDRVFQLNERKLQTRFGLLNALLFGVVFALGWTPCVGPILGSVLTYTASTSSDPWSGALYLSFYGLGFGLPLLLLAFFAEVGVRALKKIGPYLHRVEQVIGLLLIGVAVILAVNAARWATTPTNQIETALARPGGQVAPPTMLIFTSSQCSVCQAMKPLLAGLTQRCNGAGVDIREYDLALAENAPLISRFRIVGTPTFVFQSPAGSEVARLVGAQTEQALLAELSTLRKTPCPGLVRLPKAPPESPTPRPVTPACKTSAALLGATTGALLALESLVEEAAQCI
jgi:cytochrome c-type biogenesis protein